MYSLESGLALQGTWNVSNRFLVRKEFSLLNAYFPYEVGIQYFLGLPLSLLLRLCFAIDV